MSDPIVPGDPIGGEYTDSELPLSAEVPKDDAEEVENATDVDASAAGRHVDVDTVEMEVDEVEIVEPDAVIRPGRKPL
ncbi:hypothetical protein [Agromyces subbeticus]|uniref:hypothetical protein n=1 Tax=Agromyces subbeticus TaxID=293890 RepID=UPI0003B4DD86|nr:hypothetical protein [Agromyces subbeticus]